MNYYMFKFSRDNTTDTMEANFSRLYLFSGPWGAQSEITASAQFISTDLEGAGSWSGLLSSDNVTSGWYKNLGYGATFIFKSVTPVDAFQMKWVDGNSPYGFELFSFEDIDDIVPDFSDTRWVRVMGRNGGWNSYNGGAANRFTMDRNLAAFIGDQMIEPQHIMYVDVSTTVPLNDQDGSKNSPFSKLQSVFDYGLENVLVYCTGGIDSSYKDSNLPGLYVVGSSPLDYEISLPNWSIHYWLYGTHIRYYRCKITVGYSPVATISYGAAAEFHNCHISKITNTTVVSTKPMAMTPCTYSHCIIETNPGPVSGCLVEATVFVGMSSTSAFTVSSVNERPNIYKRCWAGQWYKLDNSDPGTNHSTDGSFGVDGSYRLLDGYSPRDTDVGIYTGIYAVELTVILEQTYYFLIDSQGRRWSNRGGSLAIVDIANPTEDDFLNFGMHAGSQIDSVDVSTVIGETLLTADTLNFNRDSLDSITARTTTLNNEGVAVSITPLDLRQFADITDITLVGTAKIAISPDGLSWFSRNESNDAWVNIGNLSNDAATIATLSTGGTDFSTFNGLSYPTMAEVVGDIIYHAYYFEGNDFIDSATVEATIVGDWIKDTTATLKLRGNEFVLVPSTSDTYKVNYQDN